MVKVKVNIMHPDNGQFLFTMGHLKLNKLLSLPMQKVAQCHLMTVPFRTLTFPFP